MTASHPTARTAAEPETDDYRTRLYDRYATTQMVRDAPPTPAELARTGRWLEAQIGRHLPTDRSARILDVGCGAGELVWFLQARGHARAGGIDVSAEQVALARSLGVAGIEQGDATPFLAAHPAAFSVITLFDVLEHVPKAQVVPFLDAVHGALVPGGRAIIHTANGESPFGGRYLYGDFTHETAYTARSIGQLSRAVGFRDVVVREVQPVPHGPVSAARWLLWHVLRTVLVGFVAVETGVARRHVVTQNLMAVVTK